MLKLGDFQYAPILKWKFGEISAFGSLRNQLTDLVVPVFDVPPTDEWDYGKLQRVTLSEHLRQFGARLAKYRRRHPALIDANALEKEGARLGWEEHPLTGLLERARQAGANAWPVISVDSTETYIEAAQSFLTKHDHVGWALRLKLSHLEKPSWQKDVEVILGRVLDPSRGAVLIDAGPISHWDDGFTELLVDRINHVPALLRWGNVFFCSTSFPEKRKGTPGTVARYKREDKRLFDALIERQSDLLRVPRFGDYGVEFPSKFVKGARGAKAHIRYSTDSEYVVSEGPPTKGNGYRAIVPVASKLKSLDEFRGAAFSAGDFYIDRMITEQSPGNPSRWRACATDHHITLVLNERVPLVGQIIESRQELPSETQISFMDIWSS